jgi:lipid II:glycine glycyltransferase (peptidoglycan interpeptide bridge formation enzyme)
MRNGFMFHNELYFSCINCNDYKQPSALSLKYLNIIQYAQRFCKALKSIDRKAGVSKPLHQTERLAMQ